MVARSKPTLKHPQGLWLDKGYETTQKPAISPPNSALPPLSMFGPKKRRRPTGTLDGERALIIFRAAKLFIDSYRSYWASPLKASTLALSFWPGRKVTTRRAVIGISSPVLGLRPGR